MPRPSTPEDVMRARAARLSATRCRLGWSQQDLADVVGVHVKSVKRWEAAKPGYNVPDDVLELVATELTGCAVAARNSIMEAEKAGNPVVVECSVMRPADGRTGREVGEHNARERMKADYAEAKGWRVVWSLV